MARGCAGIVTAVRDSGELVLGEDVVVELEAGRLAPLQRLAVPKLPGVPKLRKGDWMLVRGVLRGRPDGPRGQDNRITEVVEARKGNKTLVPFYPGACGERVAVKGKIAGIEAPEDRAPRVIIEGGYLTNAATSRSIEFAHIECIASKWGLDPEAAQALVGESISLYGIARFRLMDLGRWVRIEDVDHPRFRTRG